MTDEEKAALEKKIENIDNAMDSLEKAETVEDTITKLPDTVKPDDTCLLYTSPSPRDRG